MNGLNGEQFMEIVRLIETMLPTGGLSFGVIEAFDEENRRIKINFEPLGAETGWCKVLQGVYCDCIGMEALVATVKGNKLNEHVVIGIIE